MKNRRVRFEWLGVLGLAFLLPLVGTLDRAGDGASTDSSGLTASVVATLDLARQKLHQPPSDIPRVGPSVTAGELRRHLARCEAVRRNWVRELSRIEAELARGVAGFEAEMDALEAERAEMTQRGAHDYSRSVAISR